MPFTLLSLLACIATPDAFASEDTLTILTWEGYIAPTVVASFEQRHGVKLNLITFNSEPEILPLFYQHQGEADLVVAGGWTLSELIADGQLQRLNHDELSATDTIYTILQKNRAYTVPYMWGTVGIAWREDLLESPPTNWAEFVALANEHPGKVGVINDAMEFLQLVHFASGNKHLFRSVAEVRDAIDIARPLLEKVIPVQAGLSGDHPLVTGSIMALQAWNGQTAFQRNNLNHHINYQLTPTGCMLWQDDFAIAANAPHKVLAHQFLNYLNGVHVTAKNAEFVQFAPSNPMALMQVSRDYLEDPIIHPQFKGLDHCQVYTTYSSEIQAEFRAFQEEAGW